MRSVKKLMVAAVIATMSFSTVGCNLIEKTPEAIRNTVLAKVGNEEITLGDVDTELKTDIDYLKEQYGEDFESKIDENLKAELKRVREQVLAQLVDEKILLSESEKRGLTPTQEEIDKTVAERTAEIQEAWGGEEEFKKAKESYGYTDETFKEFLEEQVVLEKITEDMVKDVAVSDEEISQYYEENKASLLNYGKATTRHLLFTNEEEAKSVSDRIKNGEVTFDKLFEEYKDNKVKATAEGASEEDKNLPIAEDLGEVAHNQQNFDPEFLVGLKPLKEGEISEPIKGYYGYHIIEAKNVTETTEKEFNDELKEQIKTTVDNKKKNEEYLAQMETLKKEYNVKIYDNKL